MALKPLSELMLVRLLKLQNQLEEYIAFEEPVDIEAKSIGAQLEDPRADVQKIRARLKKVIKPLKKKTDAIIAIVEKDLNYVQQDLPAALHVQAAANKGIALTRQEQLELESYIAPAIKRLASYYLSIQLSLRAIRSSLERLVIPTVAINAFKVTFVKGRLFARWIESEQMQLLVPLREAEGYIITAFAPA
jgi:hypothetical protein